MGVACSSAAPAHVVEIGGGDAPPKADRGRSKSALTKTASSKRNSSKRSSRSSRRDKWHEGRSRSLVGNMMRTNVSLRIEDEYDDSSARVLGTGMSGQVITVRHRATGHEYAVKTLDINQMGVAGLDALRLEINAMRRLDHPNIVKLYEIFEDRDEDQIHMVMELCTGGELVEQVQAMRDGMDELDVARLVMKMLSALNHCHENDVVHRDIKLENFVYEHAGEQPDRGEPELKLIDFGLSHLNKPGQEKLAKGRVGTLSYMAPEVVNRKPYAKPCDMWSLGVVTFMMLSGRRPFHSRDREEKMALIRQAAPTYSEERGWRGVSEAAVAFVQNLLRKEPAERLTAREALQHAWLVECKTRLAQQAGQAAPLSAASVVLKNPAFLRAMQSFSSLSGMHKVALELLAFAAPSAQVDTLRAVFCAIDADGSGSISREEFSSALGAHPQLKESEVVRIFDQIDFSRQGEVSYNEFLAATLGALSGGTRGLDEESVRAVFERLDTDSDGVVTRDNLVRALGGAISSGEVDAWFEQIGCTNGKLLIGDLLRLMLEQRVEAGVHAQPLAPQLSRSLSSNNVTLTSEAQLAAKAKEELTGDGKHPRAMIWQRGRTVLNLNHFIRESQPGEGSADGGTSGGAEAGPLAPAGSNAPRRRKSMDGSVFATFSKWTSAPRGSSTSIQATAPPQRASHATAGSVTDATALPGSVLGRI